MVGKTNELFSEYHVSDKYLGIDSLYKVPSCKVSYYY